MMTGAPPRTKGFAIVAMIAAGLIAIVVASSALAQVLEIDDGGVVTRYDRPAVFTNDGAMPMNGERKTPRSTRPTSVETRSALADAAETANVSADLVEAVAWQESRLRHGLTSRAGAIGEMQLMPWTARNLGVDPFDIRQNFRGGATYLSVLMRRYDGDIIRTLAAYNAGPGAVDRFGGVPPFKETQQYVRAILNHLDARAVSLLQTSER